MVWVPYQDRIHEKRCLLDPEIDGTVPRAPIITSTSNHNKREVTNPPQTTTLRTPTYQTTQRTPIYYTEPPLAEPFEPSTGYRKPKARGALEPSQWLEVYG